jgi:peptidoglycan/LPS O-acetylase OafA/YrhL
VLHKNSLVDRNEFIDILRFISIALVLLHHFNIPYKLFDTFLTFDFLNESFITLLARNGNYGVTMFFVISGYLITSHSLKRWQSLKNINVQYFYVSRVARIIPSLILLILIVNVLGFLGLKPFITQAPNDIVVSQSVVNFAALTFWMNILIIEAGWVNYALGVLWSLSVEEVFYLAFPILAFILKREQLFILGCIFLICFCPYFRYLNYGDESGAYLYHYFSSFDGIAFGCLTAIISNKFRFSQNISVYIRNIVIAIMICIYFYGPIKETCVFGITAFSLCTSVLIMTSLSIQKDYDNFLANPLKRIGRNSYEIYLFHLVVLGLIKILFIPPMTNGNIKVLLLVVYLFIAIVLGGIIAKYFSNPLNRKIRNRFIKKDI